MTNKNSTHPMMDIVPRKLGLTFNSVAENKSVNFALGNPLLTAFVTTLSGFFPEGEKQFIRSVRNFKDQIKDENLKLEIKKFTQQEANHAIEHNTFNKRIDEQGWDVYGIERFIIKKLDWERKRRTHAQQLANTVVMEHITATFANWMMSREDLIERADPDIGKVLVWHSIEEVEHKAVAFDVFQECVGDAKMLHRFMRLNNIVFFMIAHVLTFLLVFKTKQIPKWKHIKEFFKILHGKTGLFTVIKPDMKDFYREGFHPWDHNNKELAERWIKKLGLADAH